MRSQPSIAPSSPDDVYLVLGDFGKRGWSWRELDEERTDRETVVRDLMDGQYSAPFSIVAFNTSESWSRDVSAEVADDIAQRCANDGFEAALSGELRRSTRQRKAGAIAFTAARRGLGAARKNLSLHGPCTCCPSSGPASSRATSYRVSKRGAHGKSSKALQVAYRGSVRS
jgi:hypothetical protein